MCNGPDLTAADTLGMPEIGIDVPVAEFYTGPDFSDDAVAHTA